MGHAAVTLKLLSYPEVPLMRFNLTWSGIAAVACVISHAEAGGWSVVYLHPSQYSNSRASGICGGQPVGRAHLGDPKAALWFGLAPSFANLNPTDWEGSEVTATDGTEQVGFVANGSFVQASLWTGNASSWVSLHPSVALYSKARGCADGQQVGEMIFPGVTGAKHASVWHGTANSWVDLSPPGSTHSQLNGTNGTYQVGWATFSSVTRAGVWHGQPEPWLDLHPSFASSSEGLGISPSGLQQVGFTSIGTNNFRACLWNSSKASHTDLQPAVATASQAVATSGAVQVGWSTVQGNKHASAWFGSADSWVNLHSMLSGAYSSSQATGVCIENSKLYVSGYAFRTTLQRDEAIVWIMQMSSPADFNGDDVVDGADLGVLLASWGQCEGCVADLNGDSTVDGADLGSLLSDWSNVQ